MKTRLDTPGDALPRPHERCYWLWPGRLLAGAHPGRDLAALQAAGIDSAIDLTEPGEPVAPYAEAGVLRHQRFPIPDFGLPEPALLRAALDAIDAALADGHRVLLHCRGGIGRTGLVAGCWLVERGFGAEAALALVARKYDVTAQRAVAPRSPETEAQHNFVRAWAAQPLARAAAILPP